MPVMFPVGIWLTSLLKTGLSSITLQAGMLDLILLTWAVSPLVSLSNDQCCRNNISTWQTLPNLQNGLLLKGFQVKSRPLADQITPLQIILADQLL